EFAPGSVIVKDKQRHRCIGFTGALPDFRFGSIQHPAEIEPLAPALSAPFWLVECQNCGAWRRFDVQPTAEECSSCSAILEPTLASQCHTPNGFRTDFQPLPVDEAEILVGRNRSITAEGEAVQLVEGSTGNASLALRTQARTYRVNRGPRERSDAAIINRGFTVKAGRQTFRRGAGLHSQWFDESQPAPHGFLLDTGTSPLLNIW